MRPADRYVRERRQGPPGVLDKALAGRSRADREAHEDTMRRIFIFGALIAGVTLFAIHELFKLLGLKLGLWALIVLAGPFLWLCCSAAVLRPLRPASLAGLRGRQRLTRGVAVLTFVLLVWPLWADPVAKAWTKYHGGFHYGILLAPHVPLGAILTASPFFFGVIECALVVLAMIATPCHKPPEDDDLPEPPDDPLPLRSSLLANMSERNTLTSDQGQSWSR